MQQGLIFSLAPTHCDSPPKNNGITGMGEVLQLIKAFHFINFIFSHLQLEIFLTLGKEARQGFRFVLSLKQSWNCRDAQGIPAQYPWEFLLQEYLGLLLFEMQQPLVQA